MKIPKIVRKNGRKYKYVKSYTNYILYEDTETGIRECFNRQDLGLIKDTGVMKGFKRNPENVRI